MRKLVFFLLFLMVIISCNREEQRRFLYLEGFTQGTSYHIAYNSPDSIDYHEELKEIFTQIDNSLSVYNPSSVISSINRNESGYELDNYFISVFERSQEISEKTHGAFDITVGPLVNAWGFGFTERENITPQLIDSLLQLVGWEKVRIVDRSVEKDHPDIMLDVNAIAKGYTVDVVAEFLNSKGVTDYMVEIGGEIRLKGTNRDNILWRIGVDKPVDDPMAMSRELQEVLQLTGKSIATSGNYRKFYIKDGQRFAHTIDPATGYPVQHNLLSVTVVTSTAMDADGWATALMVMGLEASLNMANSQSDMEAYFIYDLNGVSAVAYTDGFEDLIIK